MNDRVFILGAGAIGLALAVHLKNEDREVILVRTSRDDVAEEVNTISMMNEKDELIKVQVQMVSLEKIENLDGIIVIAAKSYANEMLAEKLSMRKSQSPIVVMQNGLGIELPFIEKDFSEIYRCILFSTSQKEEEHYVRYRPITASPIGVIRGDAQKLMKIVEVLNTTGFQFSAEEKIQEKIWQKAILNSVYNSICPLLGVDNGIFHRSEEVTQIALEVMRECISVASAVGITLDIQQLKQQMLTISKAADGQYISTLQDILKGRETEIDSLNMEIVRIADEQTPRIQADRTKLLGEMILLKSEISRRSKGS
jgi:2-dehydropantoate 2-reductase